MNPYLTFYLDSQNCLGNHGDGWSVPLPGNGVLPGVNALMKALEDVSLEDGKAVFLIQDALLYPLRIRLDQPATGRELEQFLLWKLKKYLPYPVEQVAVRYLPLQEENTYLTLSLPKPWLEGLFAALEARGIHCGYIGGLFTTLLENSADLRGKLCFCLYDDCYLLAELDERGRYVDFSTRRLPMGDNDHKGELDSETLVGTDLAPVLRSVERPLLALNLAPERDGEFNTLTTALRRSGAEPMVPDLDGSPLARYNSLAAGVTV